MLGKAESDGVGITSGCWANTGRFLHPHPENLDTNEKPHLPNCLIMVVFQILPTAGGYYYLCWEKYTRISNASRPHTIHTYSPGDELLIKYASWSFV